jgi:hypothetical protein
MAKRIIVKATESMKVGIVSDTQKQIAPNQWQQVHGVTVRFSPENNFTFDSDKYNLSPGHLYEVEKYFKERIELHHSPKFKYLTPEEYGAAPEAAPSKKSGGIIVGAKSAKDAQV